MAYNKSQINKRMLNGVSGLQISHPKFNNKKPLSNQIIRHTSAEFRYGNILYLSKDEKARKYLTEFAKSKNK